MNPKHTHFTVLPVLISPLWPHPSKKKEEEGDKEGEGMMMLVRTMAPEVIAVDEIGGRRDLEAIEYVRNCGCKLIATVHGSSIDDIRTKPLLRKLVQEHVFERYVVLGDTSIAGKITEVFDAQGNPLYRSCISAACI